MITKQLSTKTIAKNNTLARTARNLFTRRGFVLLAGMTVVCWASQELVELFNMFLSPVTSVIAHLLGIPLVLGFALKRETKEVR